MHERKAKDNKPSRTAYIEPILRHQNSDSKVPTVVGEWQGHVVLWSFVKPTGPTRKGTSLQHEP